MYKSTFFCFHGCIFLWSHKYVSSANIYEAKVPSKMCYKLARVNKPFKRKVSKTFLEGTFLFFQ